MATMGGSGQPAPVAGSVGAPLRDHPLVGYFLLADGLSWLALLILGAGLSLPAPLVVAIFTVGPTAAALIVTAKVEGSAGLGALLRRVVLWNVGFRWYLIALLGIPLAILLATLALPGAVASFHATSPLRWLITYVIFFVITAIGGGPLFEEPGWRGFALPRLQSQLGPLSGTILLGVLWGVWHLPQFWLVPSWAEQDGGASATNIGVFLLMVLALAPIMTWLFNHTRGSLLLAILAHASVNTTQVALIAPIFPSAANEEINLLLAFVVVALVLIVITHGRLGYRGENATTVRGAGARDRSA